MKPEKDNFSVSKIHRKKDGLSISYAYLRENGEVKKINDEDERPPGDGFIASLNSLKKYVSNIIHYGSVNQTVGNKEFNCSEDQSRFLMRLHQTLMSKIQINGIEIEGLDQSVDKCSIHFSLEGLSGQNLSTKTYKIDLSENYNTHGFEDELKMMCGGLRELSYGYLFENEGGQGDLFNQEQKEQEEQKKQKEQEKS